MTEAIALQIGVGPLGYAVPSASLRTASQVSSSGNYPVKAAIGAQPGLAGWACRSSGLRTASQARAWLDRQGISIAEWSREHNVPHGLVREILAGRKRCLRGVSHNIAVLLGMKDGVLTDRPARVPGGGRAAQRAQSAGAVA